MGERKSLVFDKCLAVVRVRDSAEKNGERERGDESASKISNFKGGAGGENYEQNAQKDASKTSNLHAGAQSARTSMDENASLRNERINFKSDAQKDASSSLNLNENAKDARCEGANQNADEPVRIGRPTGQKCEFCGCEMLDMLRLKAGEPQMRCEGEGMEKSYFSQQDMARLSGMKFKLSDEISPFYGCFDELDVTVGGYPQWVQDATYLSCPSCGGTMKHLAQIPFGELVRGEGVIYVQICEKCEVLGGCFQCT